MNKRFEYNQSQTARDGTVVKHYGLSILQADGKYDLEKNRNRGDTGDLFKTGDKVTPSSKNVHTGSYYFWKGNSATPADSGIHVTDIVENADGSITAKFYYSHSEGKN
jgi:immune inhibitor A